MKHPPNFLSGVSTPPDTSPAAPLVASRRKTFPPLSEAELEAVVLRFAGLEEVKLVAAFGPGGEVACSRGGGFDVGALARFGLMTLTLLRRSAPVRAYYLAHSLHQLFLLPLGGSTLARLSARPNSTSGLCLARSRFSRRNYETFCYLSEFALGLGRARAIFTWLWHKLLHSFLHGLLHNPAQRHDAADDAADELTGNAEDSFLARYALALESLNASLAALENGGFQDGAASLDNLERAARTLRPLSQETSSATLVGSLEATFERARTAIRNESSNRFGRSGGGA